MHTVKYLLPFTLLYPYLIDRKQRCAITLLYNELCQKLNILHPPLLFIYIYICSWERK